MVKNPPRLPQQLLGARVEAVARRRGLNAGQLSRQSGVPLSTVQKIWKGDGRRTSVWSLVKLAHVLDVSLDYLTGLTNVERPVVGAYPSPEEIST